MSESNRIRIVNGSDSIYRGTVVSGIPAPEGLIYDESVDIVAHDPVTGEEYQAAYEILSRFDEGHAAGSAKWILVGINGSFDPGTTELLLSSNPDGVREPNYIPLNWEWSRNALVKATLVDPVTMEAVDFELDLESLTPTNALEIHHANEVFMTLEWEGDTNVPDVGWRAFAFLRKGEAGIRWEFQFEQRGPGYKQTGAEPGILEDLRLVYSNNHGVSGPKSISFDRGFHEQADSIIGDLHVAYGCQTGPLTMEHDGSETTVVFVNEDSYIPQGGAWAPAARPGDPTPVSSSVDPRSANGLFFYEKIMVEFFIGAPMAQAHVNCPPQLALANKDLYDTYILGGLVEAEPFKDNDGYIQTNTGRYERLLAAYVDERACDPLQRERITFRKFAERGGTYPKSDFDNPFFGIRDFGDDVWASGYGGGNHYQAADSCLRQWLRSDDPRWFFEGFVRNRHFRIWDFSWSGPSNNPFVHHRYDGMSTYQKGHHHGNSEVPKLTHSWVGNCAIGYVLTGHPELLRACKQNASALVENYNFWGADYQPSPGSDPRDWGSPSRNHTYGDVSVRAPSGSYGDWGIRVFGRAFENSAAHIEYLGSEIEEYDLRAYMANVCHHVERIETQIWGGNGYILNRADRANLVPDMEQGWMQCYVTRGIGYALLYGGKQTEQYRPMYERWYNFLLNKLIVYGDKDANGRVRPPRVAGYFGPHGPMFIKRYGIKNSTLQKWYAWRNAVDAGQTDSQAFNEWRTLVLADVQVLDGLVEQNGEPSWIKNDPGFQAWLAALERVHVAGADVDPNNDDYKLLRAKQWSFIQTESYPAINHGMLAADTLAQGALHLGMNAQGVAGFMAIRLAENNCWHLQDPADAKHYADIRDEASDVSYRMLKFPGSETKIYPNQIDSQYIRALMRVWDKYIKQDVWGPKADEILNSYLSSAQTSAGGSYTPPHKDVEKRLDVNNELSPFVDDINESSERVVNENNPTTF